MLTSGFVVKGGGYDKQLCGGEDGLHCTTRRASLVLHWDIFFLPLEVAHMHIFHPQQQQQWLAAFCMHRWITATLRTGLLPAEGEKMLI